MKFGISTYSLTWAIGVPGYPRTLPNLTALLFLERAARSDVALVQFADNLPMNALTAPELAQVRDSAREKNLSVELGTRGTDPEHLRKYLSLAKYLNCRLVRTMVTVPELAVARAELSQVMEEFKEARIQLAIENHGLHRCSDLALLVSGFETPYLGCCLDTVNNFSALELPETVIEVLAPLTINLHIKDFTIQRHRHMMGFEILGTPAGSGLLKVDEVVRKLQYSDKKPTAVLEVWVPYTGEVEETVLLEESWLEKSLEYARTLPQLQFKET